MDTGASLSVLVIDEEPPILELISEILAENGIRGLAAQTVEEAVALAAVDYIPIDVVLADRTMVGMDAGELEQRFRALRPGIGILFMSAFVDGNVIRIQVPDDRPAVPGELTYKPGLVETIRRSCQQPVSFKAVAGQ